MPRLLLQGYPAIATIFLPGELQLKILAVWEVNRNAGGSVDQSRSDKEDPVVEILHQRDLQGTS